METPQIAARIGQLQKLGSLSFDLKQELWSLYTQVYGTGPPGSITCGDCVRDTFWKMVGWKDKYLSTPPPPPTPKTKTEEQIAVDSAQNYVIDGKK